MNERAAVITHHWETGETMHTSFEGKDAASRAHAFMEAEKKRGDFPAPEWHWTVIANAAAADRRGDRIVEALFQGHV